ncbi:hypothetical protein LAZ67_22002270 [Cordylochernes scorpioides]|uniref:Mos1 transposase HTH domain-containing protein n=1 Tax=Cordylochernes scorpioides TaxID=51811 RepID=A0ABY6LRD3_9ARAC|nr:hypothetical protein LAZ67_22002270 [Cordylochernes scorpioides]
MANNLTSPLPLNLNATDLYSEYKHWMNSYLIYELASGVSTKKDDVKRATLLHCLGPQVQRIFFNLPEEKDTYEKAKEALTKYFTPQKNIVSERFKFRQRKQNTDENIDSYVIALRELVKSCEFGNLEEDMIRDQIIEKCYNRQLKEKLLQQDNLNLQRTIEISRMFETAKEEFRVLTNEDMTSINRVNYKNNFQAANESTVKGPKAHNVYHQKGSTSKVSAPNLEECYRCGLTTHPPYKCGARNMKCTFCNKMGHLNRVCRNKNKYKNIEGKKRIIQNISENNEDSDEYTFFLGSDNKESIYIDGKEITMTIDTGSDTTFIGLENLKNIFPKSQMPTLNGTERKFYAYGQTSPLPCCGYFFADVSWGERSIKEQIFVIEGKAEPLLGKKASFELEIIKRGTKIRNIQQEVIPKDIYNLIQENMNLFQGQGNVKGYSQKITLKENVTPVAQRCRHFPYKMVEAINQELDKMIEDGIIKEVHEASEWISNIVAVPKKGTEEIRLCVDLKEVMEHNQAYKERMKKYADSKNKALPHDFKKEYASPQPTFNWYSEARVAAAKTMQVPVQRIQLWTHKPFSGLQYNTHIDYTADSSVDIGQMSRVFWIVFDFYLLKKMDQRTCIKFCVKNEIKCADAFRMLTVAYGEATLDRSNVYRWYKMFSEGREDVSDKERAGRPSTSTTDEKINEVEKMILANRRITVREVAEDLNISIGSCHSIFINDLGMRRVAAKFVPKLLNCDQKQHRMNIANEMLDSVRDDPNLLQRVITGDEAWVYGYDVETKAQSSQWKLPHEPRPKKARQVRSNVNVLLTVFFDCRGVAHHEFSPQGRTVNKEYYLQVMRNLREAIRQKRPDL